MSGLFLRSFFISCILAVLLSISVFGIAVYLLFFLGSDGLISIQKESENASIGLASTLAHMAGERISESQAVALSATMAETVEQTQNRFDKKLSNYKIDEIFLIDKSGRPLAHSNIAKLAADSKVSYKTEEFLEILDKEKRYPNVPYKFYTKEEVKTFPTELYEAVDSLSPEFGAYLRRHYPQRVLRRYHLAMAVYPVDQITAIGAVHLFVESEATNLYLKELTNYSLVSLAWGAGSVFLVSGLLFFLLILIWHGPQKRMQLQAARIREMEDSLHEASEEGTLQEDGPTATELELMEDARRASESPDPAPASDGPTATELELMEDARRRERERPKESPPRKGVVALQAPPVLRGEQRIAEEEVIYDAIPLESESLSLGTKSGDDWEGL